MIHSESAAALGDRPDITSLWGRHAKADLSVQRSIRCHTVVAIHKLFWWWPMSQTHTSAGCLLSVPWLLLLCVTDEKNILEKKKRKKKKEKKERSKRSVYFHEAEISDYNSGICSIWHWCHCKGSKNTIKLEAKIKKTNKQKITLQTQVCWQHLTDTPVTSVACLRFLLSCRSILYWLIWTCVGNTAAWSEALQPAHCLIEDLW